MNPKIDAMRVSATRHCLWTTAAVELERDEAEELERFVADILELMGAIGFDEQDITSGDGVQLAFILDLRSACDYIDLVFIVVRMSGRVPARLHGEVSHRKGRCTIVAADHHPHLDTTHAIHGDRCCRRVFFSLDEHDVPLVLMKLFRENKLPPNDEYRNINDGMTDVSRPD